MQADKLKAALMYMQNQLSVISDQESPKSSVSRLAPDVSKDVLAKNNNSKEPSLSASKIVKPSSVRSTPDFSVPTKMASLSTGKKTKLSSKSKSKLCTAVIY